MSKKKKKQKSYIELLNEVRDREPMGRPVVFFTEKDKLKRRCYSKQLLEREINNYE